MTGSILLLENVIILFSTQQRKHKCPCGEVVLSLEATPGQRVSSFCRDASVGPVAQINRALRGRRSGHKCKCSQLAPSKSSDCLSEIDLIIGRRIRVSFLCICHLMVHRIFSCTWSHLIFQYPWALGEGGIYSFTGSFLHSTAILFKY